MRIYLGALFGKSWSRLRFELRRRLQDVREVMAAVGQRDEAIIAQLEEKWKDGTVF